VNRCCQTRHANREVSSRADCAAQAKLAQLECSLRARTATARDMRLTEYLRGADFPAIHSSRAISASMCVYRWPPTVGYEDAE